MIAPMLAAPMSKADIRDWNDWMMEEKFDGHRLIIEVTSRGEVTAWTRERKHSDVSGKSQLRRELPAYLVGELKKFKPRGLSVTLDGELLVRLLDGRVGTSTDVTRNDLMGRLFFVAFDVLTTGAGSCMMQSYEHRRAILAGLFDIAGDLNAVVLADARPCRDTEAVSLFCHEVWDRGGEGLILKNRNAQYEPGKRRAAFVKIKKLKTAEGIIVGFEPTRGTVMNRGPYATVVLKLADGRVTSVKTKNDEVLAKLNRHKGSPETHPALGRVLRIEYQDDAADGGVRHPRGERWEDE